MQPVPSSSHRLKRGLTLPLAGAPEQRIHAGPEVGRVALLGEDYTGLKPTFLVQPGDRVLRGQYLFEDKKNPGLRITSPAAGTVAALHRGERRAFRSLVIDVAADDSVDAQLPFTQYTGAGLPACHVSPCRQTSRCWSGAWWSNQPGRTIVYGRPLARTSRSPLHCRGAADEPGPGRCHHLGVLIMALRHGLMPSERIMFPVSAEETVGLAEAQGLRCVLNVRAESKLAANREAGVTWSRVAFTRGIPA